jgi:hypothetical protein
MPAVAQCQASILQVEPAGAGPGREVTVTGQGFGRGCTDVIPEGQVPPPDPPQAGIRLVFMQGNRRTPLTTVDAGADYTFKVSIVVPEWARPGSATFRAETPLAPVDARFTVLAGASAHAGRSRAFVVAGGLLLLAAVGGAAVVAARHRPGSDEG